MIDCLNDNLQKGEIPLDKVQSVVDEIFKFMFENLANLFHELNQNKQQVRFLSSAMKCFPFPSRLTMKTYIGKTFNLE